MGFINRQDLAPLVVGVLDDDRLLSAIRPLRQQLLDPFVQGEWTRLHRNSFVPSYQDYVDRLIAGLR